MSFMVSISVSQTHCARHVEHEIHFKEGKNKLYSLAGGNEKGFSLGMYFVCIFFVSHSRSIYVYIHNNICCAKTKERWRERGDGVELCMLRDTEKNAVSTEGRRVNEGRVAYTHALKKSRK
jgi:hypothetical protein